MTCKLKFLLNIYDLQISSNVLTRVAFYHWLIVDEHLTYKMAT